MTKEIGLEDVVIDRRRFVNIAASIGAIGITSLLGSGCAGNNIKGELGLLSKGFNVYNKRNPNLRPPHFTWATWKDMLKRAGYNHTGYSYILPRNEPIVACASGVVIESYAKIGSGREYHKRSGDWVQILHEKGSKSGVCTIYYHMKENSRTVKPGQKVKRGQVIGYEGAPHKMHFKHYLSFDEP